MNSALYELLLNLLSLIVLSTFNLSPTMRYLKSRLRNNFRNIVLIVIIYIGIFFSIIMAHIFYYLWIFIFSFCVLFDTYKSNKDKT